MTKQLVLCALLCCAFGLFGLKTARGKFLSASLRQPRSLVQQPHALHEASAQTVDASLSPISIYQLGALESLAVAETLLPRAGVSSRLVLPVSAESLPPFYCREPWNCSESINFATSLNRGGSIYTQWPSDVYRENLDSELTWHKLECTLRRGDVVTFRIRERINGNPEIDFSTHTQICLGPANEMWGANNEPRFELVRGVPAPTKMWWVCSSHEYFNALYAQDPAWRALGHDRNYYVVVYRCPESRGSLVSR